MTIDEILEMMDEMLDHAVTVPFTGKKAMVDVDKLREYIDSIRYNLPTEIQNAKSMVSDRSKIIDDANSQAEQIIKQAEERAKKLVSESEIVIQAQEAANQLTSQAKDMDRNIRKVMSDKINAALGESETALQKSLNEIHSMQKAMKLVENAQK